MYVLFNFCGFISLAVIVISAIAMKVSENSYDSDQSKFWATICLGSFLLLAVSALIVWSTQESYLTDQVQEQIAEELGITTRNVHMGQPSCLAMDKSICYTWQAEFTSIVDGEVIHGTVVYDSEGISVFDPEEQDTSPAEK